MFSDRKGGATVEISPYTMAVKPWTGDGEVAAPTPPDVILSRGLLMNDSFLEVSIVVVVYYGILCYVMLYYYKLTLSGALRSYRLPLSCSQ